jgi:hypothetical protein
MTQPSRWPWLRPAKPPKHYPRWQRVLAWTFFIFAATFFLLELLAAL